MVVWRVGGERNNIDRICHRRDYRLGTWADAGYRAYLGLRASEAVSTSPLIVDPILGDSDETDDEP